MDNSVPRSASLAAMLTTTQAAEILNVSRVTLVKLLEDGTFDLTTDEFMSALEEIRHGQRS